MTTVFALLAHELRNALRERSLVVYTLLLPLVLYPALLWVVVSAMSFAEGQTEELDSRVSVVADAELGEALVTKLQGRDDVEVAAERVDLESALSDLAQGRLDVIVELQQADRPSGVEVVLHFDGARPRSVEARDRMTEALDELREERLAELVSARGIETAQWDRWKVVPDNVASGREMGAFLLGMLAPTTMVLMISLGALYPAIDTTAGERERSTWETTLTLGVSRSQVIVAKYLYVVAMASLAGLLNLLGLASTFGLLLDSLIPGKSGVEIEVPWASLPWLAVGTVLVAAMLGAIMMLAAAFARTYKEGQTFASPMTMLAFLPVPIVLLPDDTFGPGIAAVPIVGVVMLFKRALMGTLTLPFAVLALAGALATVGLCLAIATFFSRNEAFMIGEFGSPKALLRSMLRSRSKPSDSSDS